MFYEYTRFKTKVIRRGRGEHYFKIIETSSIFIWYDIIP